MENLFFFPMATEQLLQDAGLICERYDFSYKVDGFYHSLKSKGKNTIKLEDQLESWKIETDGLRISRRIIVEYPRLLYGPKGVACENSELGICIIWNNKYLTQMGCIKPSTVNHSDGKATYFFLHDFLPGEIKGDLVLDTVLYIKNKADKIMADEGHLINEAGVTVGEIDSVILDFDSIYMEFPVKEIKEKDYPLWWLELTQWEDPTQDTFTEDHVCLYLNSYYDYCPKVGESIKNIELLIEIITTSYLMIFQKIEGMNLLSRTIDGIDLEPGSISLIMNYFYSGSDPVLRFESIDTLHKTIHDNVERMLKGGSEE